MLLKYILHKAFKKKLVKQHHSIKHIIKHDTQHICKYFYSTIIDKQCQGKSTSANNRFITYSKQQF